MTWFRSRWPWMLAAVLLVTVMIGWGVYQEMVRELPEGLIQAAGRIEGDEVRVSAEVSARVDSVAVNEGDTVTTGQLLVELDSSRLKNQYNAASARQKQAEAQLEYVQQEYRRHETLLRRDQVSTQQYEKVRSEYLSARAELQTSRAKLDQAENDLEDVRIKSPLSGHLLARFVEPGEWAGVGTPLVEIVDLEKLYMKVYVPGPLVGKLSHGASAKIYTDAYPDEPFSGQIRRISDRAEFTPRTVETREERPRLVFAVEIAIDNPAGRLKPGMPGDAILRWDPDVDWQPPR